MGNKIIQILLLLLLSVLSAEPLLFLYAGIILFYVFKVCWRANETKHLLVNLLLYWAVVAILIPYADLVGQPLDSLYVYGKADIKQASWLGLTALGFYLVGIRMSIFHVKPIETEQMVRLFKKYNGSKIILAYVVVSIVSVLVNRAILFIPGGQLLLAVTYLKWVLLTLLIAHTLIVDSNRMVVFILVSVEILLSFSGFWAAFKDYILVVLGAYFLLLPKLSFRSYLLISSVLIFTLFISVIWTYSKGEYRRYLTGGERTQIIVQQDQLGNLRKFMEIARDDFSPKNFNSSFASGLENLIHRVSYVEFLGLSIKQVPAYIPYEEGALLKSSFEHVLKPRFLFPDKKAIFDSELTSKYTGIQFAGAELGTSFSLGTVAEAYVDFGRYYMFIPILFFGLWIGWLYRYFIVNAYNMVWGMCYAAPMFQFAWSFPVPTSKFLGWSITYFIGFWFLNKFLIKYLDKFLLNK
ncbi:MAG: hypothetical protein RLY85_526 [Bacteroidota bacterium]